MQNRSQSEQLAAAMSSITDFIANPTKEKYHQISNQVNLLRDHAETILKILSTPIYSEAVTPRALHIKALIQILSIKGESREAEEAHVSEATNLLCQLLASDQSNSLLWFTLSRIAEKRSSLTKSALEKLTLLAHQSGLTDAQFGAFCYGKAIACDEKYSFAWNNLGSAFTLGASLSDLPTECRVHFQGKDHLSPMQLKAFCCGKAIACDEKNSFAWSNLGSAFRLGASLSDLPAECGVYFQGQEAFSPMQLQAFCYGKAIACDEKNSFAWSNLGNTFARGASLSDLPAECGVYFQGQESFSPNQLQAFYCGKAIAWNNLGNTFLRGASLSDLPIECRVHFQGQEAFSPMQLQAFCYGKAIACDEKNSFAWNNLGNTFLRGASLSDLPAECGVYFQGQEAFSPMQLQAFCLEKSAASGNSAITNASTQHKRNDSLSAVNSKRKADEELAKSSKRQKTNRNQSPVNAHSAASSASSMARSSSAPPAAIPQGFVNPSAYPNIPNPNVHPHLFFGGVNAVPTNTQARYTPTYTYPPLGNPTMGQGGVVALVSNPAFFQRPPALMLNPQLQQPQPEVQITGNGQIPALNNLAHQATLIPTLAHIKEEPSESKPHDHPGKKM